MPIGLLTGLAAAVCWGTLDLFSALASRRIGSCASRPGCRSSARPWSWVTAVATGTRLSTDPFVLVGGSLVGLAGAGAYSTYFTGLRIGPIAVVSGWSPRTAA